MKTFAFITICLFSVNCFGQTKLISFKSHSGNTANFRLAVEHNLFDIGDSNFGNPPPVRVDKVDTVILKAKNKIIVLRKTYIINWRSKAPQDIFYIKDTLTTANADTHLFMAGTVDSLKIEIREMYRKSYKFVKLDSTCFIGFNKKFKQNQLSPKK